ncbi:glycosyltransferase family 2 protein [Ekhidna sp.]
MPEYSIIIPVYNRPEEVDELLNSLTFQTFTDFEVLIVEDGSNIKCEEIVSNYSNRLDITYFYKKNSGQGFSRNYGFERAKGNWLIVFDSDCLIPESYLKIVDDNIKKHQIDAFGGPDRAHESFTSVQKAISYSMTSLFTTGGIRGNKKHVGKFHPRSFNMGISKEVYKKTQGYQLPRKGEDIEFSIRIIKNGFKTSLIEDAYVYHKRRTSFSQFFKQLHFFGTARINVYRFYKEELKLIHFFPSIFFIGLFLTFSCLFLFFDIAIWGLAIYGLYFFSVFIDSSIRIGSIKIGFFSIVAAFIQLSAYGLGLIKEGLIYLRKG